MISWRWSSDIRPCDECDAAAEARVGVATDDGDDDGKYGDSSGCRSRLARGVVDNGVWTPMGVIVAGGVVVAGGVGPW